uniref:Putative secreted protein n=1 Tax=Anopheles darlingi TaxID=43151 RepID=A0A2M4DD41_ANODA
MFWMVLGTPGPTLALCLTLTSSKNPMLVVPHAHRACCAGNQPTDRRKRMLQSKIYENKGKNDVHGE